MKIRPPAITLYASSPEETASDPPLVGALATGKVNGVNDGVKIPVAPCSEAVGLLEGETPGSVNGNTAAGAGTGAGPGVGETDPSPGQHPSKSQHVCPASHHPISQHTPSSGIHPDKPQHFSPCGQYPPSGQHWPPGGA